MRDRMTVPAPSWPALEEAAIRGDLFPWMVAVVREQAAMLTAAPCPVVRLDERKETK